MGSAWLGVKVTISSFLGLAFLVHVGGGAGGQGWRGSSDCDFHYFLLFSNFLSTECFMCMKTLHVMKPFQKHLLMLIPREILESVIKQPSCEPDTRTHH